MNSFKNWYVQNQDAITWFLIGWLSWGLLDQLAKGNWGWATANALLIWVNYKMIRVRLQ